MFLQAACSSCILLASFLAVPIDSGCHIPESILSGSLLLIGRVMVFCITFLLVANIPEYINAQRIGLFPYQFYIAFIVALLFLALLSKAFLNIPKANFYVIAWFVALVVCCLISALVVSRSNVAMDEINKIGMFCGMGASMALVLSNRNLLVACGYGVLAAVVLCTVLTYMEFFDPNFNVMADAFFETQIRDGVIQRSGGIHGNPNANGYALGLGMFIAQFFLPKSLRLAFIFFVGFAVFTTVSRSAMLLWMIIVMYGFWSGVYLGRNVFSKVLATALLVGLYVSLAFGAIPNFLNSVGLDEYMSDQMIERLSGDFFTQGDDSSLSRLDAAVLASDLFSNNPIVGAGLGTARGQDENFGDVGAHNMLVRVGAELGILGVLVYLALLIVPILANSKAGFVFVLFYFFLNFFTHTSFEKSAFAMLIPFGILYFSVNRQKNPRKKRRRRRSASHSRDNFREVSA